MAKRASKPPAAANGATTQSAAYFLSLSVENVRCFKEKQTLDLSDGKGGPARWTILLGDNGTGKTTLLQALVALESGPHRLPVTTATDQGGPRPLSSEESKPYLYHFERIGLFRSFPRHEGAQAALEGAMIGGGRFTAPEGEWKTGQLRVRLGSNSGGIAFAWDAPGGELRIIFPLFCAYGAGRRLGDPSLREPAADDPVATILSETATLRNAEEWLLRLDYSASKTSSIQKRLQGRLQQVRELLVGILPEVEDTRFTTPGDALPTPRIEFRTPYGWVPLRALGYGYQTLIAWMVDFASRMVERYPDSPDPLAEPAIVLVDEIDLHLHPQWQRKLIGFLTERFPNTQFIVTAHSPLVVQAATGANLAVLRREGDQVVIDNDVEAIRGWRIDQIYTSELFGLPSARPPELDRKLERRKELLLKDRLSGSEKKELAELNAVVDSLPVGETPEQTELLRSIQQTLDALRQQQPAGT